MSAVISWYSYIIYMESVDDLFLSLKLSQELRKSGLLFDGTVALRNKQYDSVSYRKNMFTIIPSLHIPAPSTEELWHAIPKRITLDDITFYLMYSVDKDLNAVSWYEAEDGAATKMITGEDMKSSLTMQLLFLLNEDIVKSTYINRREWER
jgi:hypothetical protein